MSPFRILAVILVIGNFLGFPVPDKNGNFPKKSGLLFIIVYGLLMSCFTLVAVTLSVIRWKTTVYQEGFLNDVWGMTYFSSIFCGYAYILLRRGKLSKLLKEWNRYVDKIVSGFHNFSSTNGNTDFLVISYFCVAVLIAIAETLLFDSDVRGQDVEVNNPTFLEKYFDVTFYKVEKLGSCLRNEYFLGLIYAVSKIATMSSFYGDILCISLCRVISSQHHSLNRNIKKQVGQIRVFYKDGQEKGALYDKISWDLVHMNLVELRRITEEISSFLSPIFFASMVLTVFQMLGNLDGAINPYSEFVLRREQIDFISVSLINFSLRLIFLVHFVSKLKETSDETLDIIENIPTSPENWHQTERILTLLRRKPICFVLFGTISISKRTYISILSFAFTIEIMVLQASNGYSNNSLN